MFYSIFERAGHIEFHTSQDKFEVQLRRSLNKRIPLDHPNAAPIILGWMAEIDVYGLERVPTQVVDIETPPPAPPLPTSTARVVDARARELSVILTDSSDVGVWEVTLDAPAGHTFKGTGLHTVEIRHEGAMRPITKAHFWAEVLQEMDAGLDRCVNHTTDANCIAYDCPGAPS